MDVRKTAKSISPSTRKVSEQIFTASVFIYLQGKKLFSTQFLIKILNWLFLKLNTQ